MSEMFIGVVFPAGMEGVSGSLVAGSDLEVVKAAVEGAVAGESDSEDYSYDWSESNGVSSYTPVNDDAEYGYYPWARVYSSYEYQIVSYSEYS